MSQYISSADDEFMRIALIEAKEGLRNNEFPVGAVLTIDGKLFGTAHNENESHGKYDRHAENLVLKAHSANIRSARKSDKKVVLYTTLEPCLMCMGAACFHRISRIVYACPAVNSGVAHVDPSLLHASGFYKKMWPEVTKNVFKNESLELLLTYMRSHPEWNETVPLMEALQDS